MILIILAYISIMSDNLIEEIRQGCVNCPWRDRKSVTVPPEGPIDSPLMVIGRNPGYVEDQNGRPFIGPAGKHLDRLFDDAGISRSKVYITNTVKCYGGPGDPCPIDEVFDCCEDFLKRELNLVKPKLIMPFGFDAYRRITGDTAPISSIQGQRIEFRHLKGQVYFPMTHPSMWARTKGYYEKTILHKVIPEFRRVLTDLGILDQLI
jgi:DNA polymerase